MVSLFLFFTIVLNLYNAESLEFKNLDDGVYVHFGKQEDSNKNNLGDISNFGFIVGSKSIAVIDSGASVKLASEMLKKIKKTSNLPISHVIITHSHPDHFLGTEALMAENPIVIGHEKLNRSMINNFEFYKNLQFSLTEDKSLKSTKLILAEKLIKIDAIHKIDLGDRKLSIKAWSSGHTDNDLSIYDEKTKIFWSENIFVDRTPSIRASIKGWKKNLEDTLDLDIKKIVPGHGPVLSKNKAIMPMLNYFNTLIEEVREFHKSQKSLKYVLDNISKDNNENWILFEEYHMANVTKTYTELEWE